MAKLRSGINNMPQPNQRVCSGSIRVFLMSYFEDFFFQTPGMEWKCGGAARVTVLWRKASEGMGAKGSCSLLVSYLIVL